MKLGKTGHKILRRLFLVGVDCVTAFFASIISYWIVNGAIAWTSLSMYMWAVVNAILLVAVFSVMELYSIALSSISVGDSLRIIFGGFIVLIANIVFALIAFVSQSVFWCRRALFCVSAMARKKDGLWLSVAATRGQCS